MSELSNAELEGRLIGQRRVLAMLLADAARASGDSAGWLDRIEAAVALELHAEDPGAVPAAGFAIEAAAMRETVLIVEGARARTFRSD